MARTALTLPISGKKLRSWRELRGWHQADLAQACEKVGHRVARDRISRIETGAVKPTPPQLTALIAALAITVEDVLEDSKTTTRRSK